MSRSGCWWAEWGLAPGSPAAWLGEAGEVAGVTAPWRSLTASSSWGVLEATARLSYHAMASSQAVQQPVAGVPSPSPGQNTGLCPRTT